MVVMVVLDFNTDETPSRFYRKHSTTQTEQKDLGTRVNMGKGKNSSKKLQNKRMGSLTQMRKGGIWSDITGSHKLAKKASKTQKIDKNTKFKLK